MRSFERSIMDISTDNFHEARVSSIRYFKGGMVELLAAAAELSQLKQILGDGFYDFARTRLGLTRAEAALFIRLFETAGLDAVQFSPIVKVKMPRLLEVLGLVVAIYKAAAAPGNTTEAMVMTSTTATNAVTSVLGTDSTKSADTVNDITTDDSAADRAAYGQIVRKARRGIPGYGLGRA